MALYPLTLFSSFANVASVKTDKRKSKFTPGSFHRDSLSVSQENNNADKRKNRRCVRSIIQGGRMENRNEGRRWTEVREAIDIQKINLKNANSKVHWK